MKRLLALPGLLVLYAMIPAPVQAQQYRIVTTCGALAPFGPQSPGSTAYPTMDVTGHVCTSGGGGGGGGVIDIATACPGNAAVTGHVTLTNSVTVKAVTSNYTADPVTDCGVLIQANSTSPITITLPDAVANPTFFVQGVQNINTGAMTVASAGGTINGATTQGPFARWEALQSATSNGANYFAVISPAPASGSGSSLGTILPWTNGIYPGIFGQTLIATGVPIGLIGRVACTPMIPNIGTASGRIIAISVVVKTVGSTTFQEAIYDGGVDATTGKFQPIGLPLATSHVGGAGVGFSDTGAGTQTWNSSTGTQVGLPLTVIKNHIYFHCVMPNDAAVAFSAYSYLGSTMGFILGDNNATNVINGSAGMLFSTAATYGTWPTGTAAVVTAAGNTLNAFPAVQVSFP